MLYQTLQQQNHGGVFSDIAVSIDRISCYIKHCNSRITVGCLATSPCLQSTDYRVISNTATAESREGEGVFSDIAVSSVDRLSSCMKHCNRRITVGCLATSPCLQSTDYRVISNTATAESREGEGVFSDIAVSSVDRLSSCMKHCNSRITVGCLATSPCLQSTDYRVVSNTATAESRWGV